MQSSLRLKHSGILSVSLLTALTLVVAAEPEGKAQGPYSYEKPDAFGNAIPDFSMAGYRNGGVAIPSAPVAETLKPGQDADDTDRIQAAIDRVAKLPRRAENGICGAVLLTKGTYRCGKTLRLPPGVTLRGQGQDADGTVIIATMIPPENSSPTLIRISGDGGLKTVGNTHAVLDETVPLGARKFRVQGANEFKRGDLVIIERASTEKWIHDLKMDQMKLGEGDKQWTPDGYKVRWFGRVTSAEGEALTLDVPVLCSIERKYGGGHVQKAEDTRGSAAAVESLRMESVYEKGKENSDERHAWNAIAISNVVDSWVRDVTAVHFAYSCVQISKNAARITVQDCAMLDPVSKIEGGRRYSFVGGGAYVLFQRCYARNGRHDFVTGSLDTGPTVFLDCLAEKTHSDIGPHHRWACGQLYDNVKGGQINVQDRGGSGSGHGWAGNGQVFWNCEASSIICQKPWIPGAQNWAIGCIGAKGRPMSPDRPQGIRESEGTHVTPRSLYLAQLAARFEKAGGKSDEALRAITTPEQRQGTVWEQLHKRFGGEEKTKN